jgi:hypothetical protein
MGGLFKRKPKADYRFLPRYPGTRLRMVTEQSGNAMRMMAVGSSQWFNPASPSDRSLTLQTALPPMVETDSLEILQTLQNQQHAPRNGFVVYQHWWEPSASGGRPVGALKPDQVAPIAAALRGGPTRHFILVTGGFVERSIQRLGLELQGHDLDTLGLFWYFSGDDISDVPSAAQEIVETCKLLKVKRLSILTGAFNQDIERKLAQGLGKLEACGIFQKDDGARYPRFPSPTLDRITGP